MKNRTIYIILFLITVFAYRFFINNYYFYTTMDFGFPISITQAVQRYKNTYSIVNYRTAYGYTDNQESLLNYYSLSMIPFALIFGMHGVKAYIIALNFFAGISMFVLLRYFKISGIFSFFGAVYFMFNPFIYSRIMWGLFDMATTIVFLPLLILFASKFLKEHLIINNLFLTVLLFILSSMHPSGLIMSSLVLFSVFVLEIYRKRNISLLPRFIFLLFLIFMLNSHWIMPMANNYLRHKPYLRGAITESDVENFRKTVFVNSGRPFYFPVMFYNDLGLSTEYAFPVQNNYYWFASQIPFLLFVIFALIIGRRKSIIYFLTLFLIYVSLTSGSGNIIGKTIFEKILYQVKPVFFEFSNSSRFMPLSILYGSILFFLAANLVYLRFPKARNLIIIVLTICISVRIFPYFDKSMTRSKYLFTMPLAYMKVKDDESFKNNLSFVAKKTEDRKGYLPPFQTSPVHPQQLNWATEGKDGPGGDFFNGTLQNFQFQHFIISALITQTAHTHLGKILGLANVGWITMPDYVRYFHFMDFGKFESSGKQDRLYDSDSVLKDNLAKQSDLVKQYPSDGNKYYYNVSNLPRMYGFNKLYLLLGNYDLLYRATEDSEFNFQNSNVVYIKNTDLRDIGMITDVITDGNDRTSLYFRLVDPKYQLSYQQNPDYLVENNYHGEFEYAAIPSRSKGLVFRQGSYELGESDANEVFVGKIILNKSGRLEVDGVDICKSQTACLGFVEQTLTKRKHVLNIPDKEVAFEYLYILPAKEWNLVKTRGDQLLQGKNLIDIGNKKTAERYFQATAAEKDSTYEKLDTNEFSLQLPKSGKYIYLSYIYDDDWIIEGNESIRKFPGGADGMIFVLNDRQPPKTVKIIHKGQKFMNLGYLATNSTWLILFAVVLYLNLRIRNKKYD